MKEKNYRRAAIWFRKNEPTQEHRVELAKAHNLYIAGAQEGREIASKELFPAHQNNLMG